jgi:hypothetical protein
MDPSAGIVGNAATASHNLLERWYPSGQSRWD